MRIAVISDDLTGANATGVLLKKQGISTATILHGFSPQTAYNYDAICIDTDSRYTPKHVAYQRVSELIGSLSGQGVELFCKRIDSTARGNIGGEIDACLDALGEDSVAVVLPSYPVSGRTTVGGYLLVYGTPVQETDVAKDPQAPLNESHVPSIISRQSSKPVATLEMSEVLQGAFKLSSLLQQKINEGSRIIVADAVNEEQIAAVAKAMASLDQTFVPVDPGPLTAAYVKEKYNDAPFTPKILLTIGSCTKVTGRQIHHLAENLPLHTVTIDPLKLARDQDGERDEEIAEGVEEGLRLLEDQSVVLVTTFQKDAPLLDLQALAKEKHTTEASLAKRITDGLAIVSQRIIQKSRTSISGCFSSGGDVTASLCAAGKTHGIQLLDEVFPLAAYGRFIGGYLDGLPVVTKGGMVGSESAITDSVLFLQRQLTTKPHEKEILS
ncbi:four-carbon acid sugar kinase family protein [Fictibacillus terranigra]|uniref:Four-carbon acid sugar kinase family protein n=1 Tax=Fictibacillus terranigra TaxID=3058424 RepID=A0ABT8E1B4_9BACL|nr:four-carbon acid sugar kinase family protein [Fictibacillus sp. CENA-BCM004]MDN4071683.1 four-carbon acid sugar kinase family protein [Fictibacillus sp. CENA-BCM004]